MPESWFHEGGGGVGAYIRAQRELSRMSLRELARLSKVSNAYLSQVERGLHEPSVRVLRAVASAMSIPLDELMRASSPHDQDTPTHGNTLEQAIRAESRLSRTQKDALVAVYHSFLKETPDSPARRAAAEQGGTSREA